MRRQRRQQPAAAWAAVRVTARGGSAGPGVSKGTARSCVGSSPSALPPYPNLGVCCPELGGLLPQPLLRKSMCSARICANVCLSSFSRSVKLRRDLLASKG